MQTAKRDKRQVTLLDDKMIHEVIKESNSKMTSCHTDTGRITDDRKPVN